VVEEILGRKAEVGFLGAHLAHPRLRLVPYAEDEIILVAPNGHALADSGVVELSDLQGQAFVEREGGSGTLGSLRQLLVQQGLEMPEHRVAMVAGTSQAQLTAIEAGLGLGFVSSLALSSRSYLKVTSIEIKGVTLRRTLYLAHEQGTLSPVAQAFVKFAVP
jgi:DNA-binding transcriptional LysR family regulator